MYFINPSPEKIKRALESWQWIGIGNKLPIKVTAFGDIFFQDKPGIWFLDTIEGSLEKVCDNIDELNKILESEDGQDHYLLTGFIIRARNEGLLLEDGQCYDFKINPVIGGPVGASEQKVTVSRLIPGCNRNFLFKCSCMVRFGIGSTKNGPLLGLYILK